MFTELIGMEVHLNGSLLGFEGLDCFVLEEVAENNPFIYLQSKEENQIGFVATSPFIFNKEYKIELSEQEQKELGLESEKDALVLGVVTIREPFAQSTINFLAPIIVNIRNGKGMQIVLPPKYGYDTKVRLFTEGGDR